MFAWRIQVNRTSATSARMVPQGSKMTTMTTNEPHPEPARSATSIGLPRHGRFDPVGFERAVTDLLHACGIAVDSVHTSKTAQRVRELWQRRLLGGYELDPAAALGDGFEDTRRDMVVVRGIAVHG